MGFDRLAGAEHQKDVIPLAAWILSARRCLVAILTALRFMQLVQEKIRAFPLTGFRCKVTEFERRQLVRDVAVNCGKSFRGQALLSNAGMAMRNDPVVKDISERLRWAQIDAFHAHLPGIIGAPAAGAVFSAWVLWGHTDNLALVVGLFLVVGISVLRMGAYLRYSSLRGEARCSEFWPRLAIGMSFLSGLVWGGAAVFLFPPTTPEYSRYLIILFALVPVAPVAALACYRPTFYAYYLPAALPFVIRLLAEGDRAGVTAAVLLIILMFATIGFANRFHKNLLETFRLRILTEEQNDQIGRLLKHKQQHLVDAGHDLRQPVQALDMMLHTMSGSFAADDVRPKLQAMDAAVQNLSAHISRMQSVAAAENPSVEPGPVDMNPILARVCEIFAPIAASKGLRFCYVETSALVNGAEAEVEDIIRNLVFNAVHHTQTGGVVFGMRRTGSGGYMFAVYDTGPGIVPEDQDRIFDDFVRLPSDNDVAGRGLGLAIARRSAQRIGAELSIASVAGRGTRFTCRFQVRIPDAGR